MASNSITEQLRRAVLAFAQQVHDEAIRGIVDELQTAAPLGQTGETRRQIRAVPTGDPSRPASRVEAPTKQGEYVEEGTPPHEIVAVNARALRFLGGGGRISTASPNQRIAAVAGGVVFAKSVHHPGTPPRPWFQPVVDTYEDRLQQAADGVVVTV